MQYLMAANSESDLWPTEYSPPPTTPQTKKKQKDLQMEFCQASTSYYKVPENPRDRGAYQWNHRDSLNNIQTIGKTRRMISFFNK